MAAAADVDHPLSSEAGFAAVHSYRAATEESKIRRLAGEYEVVVAGMRDVFDSGRTKDLAWRRAQLESLVKGIQDNVEAITDAIGADLGGGKLRAVFDMGPAIGDAEFALANLTTWATPFKTRKDMPFDVQSTWYVRPEPKGVILNIGPFNFPVNLNFQPLVCCLAAGNCVLLKPSELAPHCSSVIKKIVEDYLDNDCIKVIEGAVSETTALLEQRWDHIIYTGNGVVGRIIMEAAAKHLTPITLELGGKSPVLVDRTANMKAVVNRVFTAKSMNNGQICIAPDYVVIDETRREEFLSEFTKQVRASNFAEGGKDNPHWGTIINSRHAERLKRLIDTSGGEAVCGGSAHVDTAARFVPMTVLKDVAPDAPIMSEEIFGPLLPVVSVKSMDEGLQMVKERERPLAIYIFSEDKAFQERVLAECPSGGACVNAATEHYNCQAAPFGGTGASGIGRYRGKWGFDEFSHFRTVLYKTGSMSMLPPPEQQPAWLYDVALKFMVTGFVRPETKRRLKAAGYGALALGAAAAARSRL